MRQDRTSVFQESQLMYAMVFILNSLSHTHTLTCAPADPGSPGLPSRPSRPWEVAEVEEEEEVEEEVEEGV